MVDPLIVSLIYIPYSLSVISLLLISFTVSACAPGDEMTVTFDGDECIYSGPSGIETGTYRITVSNTSGLKGWERICRGNEGYTWEDMLDHDFTDDDDVDDYVEWPSWCMGAPSKSVAESDSSQVVYEYKFRHEGQHFILWEQDNPDAAWRCAPLTVLKAASE